MKMQIVIEASSGPNSSVPIEILEPFFGNQSMLEICIEKMKSLNIPISIRLDEEGYEDDFEESENHEKVLSLAGRLGVDVQTSKFEESNKEAEYILYVKCTNPLISIERYRTALQIPPEKWRGFDSLNSSYFVNGRVWHGRSRIDNESDDVTVLEGSINIISREALIARGDFVGENPAFIMIPDSETAGLGCFQDIKAVYASRHNGNVPERKINIIKKHL